MGENRIDKVKQDIGGILISYPQDVSLEEFLKAFKTISAPKFPHREFGYTSEIDFLKSLPDVVFIKKDIYGVYKLSVITDESNKHIKKLVSKQRTVKPKQKRNSNRRYEPKVRTAFSNSNGKHKIFVPALLRTEVIEIVKQYPDGISFSSLLLAYNKAYNKTLNLEWLSGDIKERFKILVSAIPELSLKVCYNQEKLFFVEYQNGNMSLHKTTSSFKASSDRHSFEDKKHVTVPEDVSLHDKTLKGIVPKSVKQNIEKVLKIHNNGILAVHFPILYEKTNNEVLDMFDLGYNSFYDLLDDLTDIVCKDKDGHSSDCKIYHRDFAANIRKNLRCKFGISSSTSEVNKRLQSPLCPDIDIPVDAVPANTKFAFKELPEDAYNLFFPVYISAVINLSLFWYQTQDTISCLNQLEEDMKHFYCLNSNKFQLADVDVFIGSSCVAFSTADKQFYRSVITSLPTVDYATVLFVDYGSWEKIPRSKLYYLKFSFMNLPAQAFKAELAYIRPPLQESSWCPKTNQYFIQLCNSIYTMANVSSVKNDKHSVFLCDMGEQKQVHINDHLVEKGLAEVCDNDDFHFSPCGNGVSTELSSGRSSSELCFSRSDTSSPCDILLKESGKISHLQQKELSSKTTESDKLQSETKHFVKKLVLGDGYSIHILKVAGEAYVSGDDLCSLFWEDKDVDCLALRLKFKEVWIPTLQISEDDFNELFSQCQKYSVKGFGQPGEKKHAVLYPLKYTMKVLNTFGHASIIVRESILKEIETFNSHSSVWTNFQQDNDSAESMIENKQLSLYDLQAMYEGLHLKRQGLLKQLEKQGSNKVIADKIGNIDYMRETIKEKMTEIDSVCQKYGGLL